MRKPDWERRLACVVEEHRSANFEWGKTDCYRFPLACADAMTGSNRLASAPAYDTRLSAHRVMRERGWDFVGDAFAEHFREIEVPFMARGDLAVVRDGRSICGAVCVGNNLVAMAERGLAFLPRSHALRAFKI